MKMTLNLFERLRLVDFLPTKGGLEKATIAADIKKKIEVSKEEIEEYEIKTSFLADGRASTSWNEKGREEKEFDFSKLEIEMIKDGFEEKNKKGEILAEAAFLDLCRKIKALEVKE